MSRSTFRVVRTFIDGFMIMTAWLIAYIAFDQSMTAAASSALVVGLYSLFCFADGQGWFTRDESSRAINKLAETCTTLRGERATLAGWIAEALPWLEHQHVIYPNHESAALIESGKRLVVAVRGGER